MELQIDTSSRYASVGLSVEGRTVVEVSWLSKRNHSVELAPAINRALDHAGAGMSDLSAVYVAEGPGAFSALRVGMSAAKSIASARGIPLVTAGTLDIEIQPFRGLGWPVCAIAGAGRNRVYVGRMADDGGETALDVQSRDEFLASATAGVLYCGEAAFELADRIESSVGSGALICASAPPTRRMSNMAHICHGKLTRGEIADTVACEPIYLRSSQIESATRRWASDR